VRRTGGLLLLLMLLLTGGCQPPRPPIPTIEPAQVASLDLDAQRRVLESARRDFDDGRCVSALPTLHRFLTAHPDSPLLPEARWWLARCYEQLGDVPRALDQYRALAGAMPRGAAAEPSYTGEARQRLTELDPHPGDPPTRSGPQTGLFVSYDQLLALGDVERWILAHAQRGVTVLVLEASSRRGTPGQAEQPGGVLFRTAWTTTSRNVFGEVIPVAHRHGVLVFASVTVRRMPWLHPQLGWSDWAYDPPRRERRPSIYLDLFNPAFQEYLVGLLTDLAQSGVDGVLFRADAPVGPTEGFSRYALEAYEREFGARLEPTALYDSGGTETRSGTDRFTPAFWRWAGWKTREGLKVMERVRQAMRRQAPRLQIILEVHPDAATNPARALAEYSEDVVEAKKRRFDRFLLGLQQLDPSTSLRVEGPASLSTSIQRLSERLGDRSGIWVAVPQPPDSGSSRAALAHGVSSVSMPPGLALP